ncbi:MAG: hypothetical protein QNJ18_18235 [Xenococcaceae cyanobacterium MO_167.B52]|nr:hypothetical protein [Xenococcaceae cyanobacterium MO_167.B52]
MNQSKISKKHLVGVFFRTDRELNLKIKIAAFSEELSQQELINKALRAYFVDNPVDLSEFAELA